MPTRLHLPGPLRTGLERDLGADQRHYLLRVMRLREGDALEVFDGAGRRFEAKLARLAQRDARVLLGAELAAAPESALRVTLAQCISGAEKMDWTIEKAVELGAHGIVPISSARSIVRLDPQRAARRVEHWQRLVAAACAQCGRDTLADVAPPQSLESWLESRDRGRGAIVLAPGAQSRLASLAFGSLELDLLVGPEGGLSDSELAAAERAGFVRASLGPRVLRTETAGLAALAVLQSRYGDL
ncbi:MAG: 16S rRNA (uracil(1498)-N(3))-methyltransferase [Burkholderiaceae bacterium]|nr:16S rRNA (uracil(1498)-N(3))-methyltransferase [Burkholderiaceae bacterium]